MSFQRPGSCIDCPFSGVRKEEGDEYPFLFCHLKSNLKPINHALFIEKDCPMGYSDKDTTRGPF
jgi:hypothetical protein